MTRKQELERELAKWRFLNSGRGPVVPKALADELQKHGITEGYVENKLLPTQ